MRAGYDGWGRAALMMVQGTPRALVAVKVRADFMPDGEIVPLLFRPEQGNAMRIDRILEKRREDLAVLGAPAMRYTVRCGEYVYDLYFDKHRQPHWFVLYEVAKITEMMVSEIDTP